MPRIPGDINDAMHELWAIVDGLVLQAKALEDKTGITEEKEAAAKAAAEEAKAKADAEAKAAAAEQPQPTALGQMYSAPAGFHLVKDEGETPNA